MTPSFLEREKERERERSIVGQAIGSRAKSTKIRLLGFHFIKLVPSGS